MLRKKIANICKLLVPVMATLFICSYSSPSALEKTDTKTIPTVTMKEKQLSFKIIESSFHPNSPFRRANDGKKFLSVDMEIENNRSDDVFFNANMIFSIELPDGTYKSLFLPEGEDKLSGNINSGAKKNGTLWFEVDESLEDVQLIIDTDSFGSIRNNICRSIKNPNSYETPWTYWKNESTEISSPSTDETINVTETQDESGPIFMRFTKGSAAEIDFSVESALYSNTYDGKEAPEGYKYLYFTLDVTNSSKKNMQITSIMTFTLKDSNNKRYNLMLPELDGINGKLAPGDSTHGTLVYMVKDHEKEFTLNIKPFVNRSENMNWKCRI